MDSGNSGSLQSSSGGDEEYDSRAAESVSAFLSSGGGGPISNTPPPFYDPLSNYLHLHQTTDSSSLLSSTPVWPRIRPGPTHLSHDNNIMMTSPYIPSFQPPPPAAGRVENPTLAPPQNQNPAAARASKKRSRASRRAPTTVLTTDTTNFRAMVQEFTGIPAPPFNNSSFPRNRLDIFSTRSAAPPPYLRRPFPQKFHPPHSLLTSAALDGTTAAASSSYQIPISQNSNLFNIPNPLLTSFLQSNPKFPFSNSPKMGGLDEQFSLGHTTNVSDALAGLPNLIHPGSDRNAARWNDGDRKDDGDVNFPASNFKAAENVGGRGEGGMVESWICSSD
ncbi:hypothetical protein ACS0TY_029355 [Phlomoides rotata]